MDNEPSEPQDQPERRVSAAELTRWVEEYLVALRSSAPPGYDFEAEWARRYVRILCNRTDSSGSSIHAFIDRRTGNVIKPASWSQPQRNSDRSLAVRWKLADSTSRQRLFNLVRGDERSFAGSYLYAR